MSKFYLVKILNEPNSLTIVTRKKLLKMGNYVLILSFFFPNENQEFAVYTTSVASCRRWNDVVCLLAQCIPGVKELKLNNNCSNNFLEQKNLGGNCLKRNILVLILKESSSQANSIFRIELWNEPSSEMVTLMLLVLTLAGKCTNRVSIFSRPKNSDTPSTQTCTSIAKGEMDHIFLF